MSPPMLMPPPLPASPRSSTNWTLVLVVVAVVGLVLIGGGYLAVRSFLSTDFTRSADNKFGDQNLKTAVALIELHKVRDGRYPASLQDLKFVGDWDQLALHSVAYMAAPDGSAYYVEVSRGWVGRPTFTMPLEFWRGTGYSEALRPADR